MPVPPPAVLPPVGEPPLAWRPFAALVLIAVALPALRVGAARHAVTAAAWWHLAVGGAGLAALLAAADLALGARAAAGERTKAGGDEPA